MDMVIKMKYKFSEKQYKEVPFTKILIYLGAILEIAKGNFKTIVFVEIKAKCVIKNWLANFND